MFFPERERTVLRYWVGSWAAICVASCLFTVSANPFFVLFNINARSSVPQCQALNFQFDGDKSWARQKCSLRNLTHPLNPVIYLSLFWLPFAKVFIWVLPYFRWLKNMPWGEQKRTAWCRRLHILPQAQILPPPRLLLHRVYYDAAETTLALWQIPRIDILPVSAYFSINLAKHMRSPLLCCEYSWITSVPRTPSLLSIFLGSRSDGCLVSPPPIQVGV